MIKVHFNKKYTKESNRIMDTEVIATSAVKRSVSVTDYLSPYINERDKEPIWDGSIYVFSKPSKLNKFCKGRVPVQVKGKESKDLSNNTITYPIRTDDLRKYLTENGVIYFVVYVAIDGSTRIYYTNLLPFKIKQLLNDAGKQKTKSVLLTLFPTDKTEKVDLFINFLHDRERQKSVSNIELMSVEQLEKMGQLKELSFGFTSTRKDIHLPFDYFFNHSFYIYATIQLGIKVPVRLMDKIISAGTTIDKPISCNGKEYYSSYGVVHKKDFYEFHFGESTIFEVKKDTNNCTMKFNLQGTLRQQITDQTFFIEMIKSGFITVGEVVFQTKTKNVEEIECSIHECKEHLEYLKNVRAALDEAGVKDDDLDCYALSDTDEVNLRILVDTFVHHKAVSFGESTIEPVGKMTIANLCIMLIARKQENGLYRLSNFFNDHITVRVEDKENDIFDTSQFVIMNKENFLILSNINYDAIYNDVVKVVGNKAYYEQITNLLLNMLLAYDVGGSKNEKLLNAAYKIAKWLLMLLDDKDDIQIRLLNYLQTVKRSRDFNEDEKKQLYSVIESGNAADAILIGAYILLGNTSGAKLHYDKLSPEEQDNFSNYPIYNLWNKV